MEGVQNSDSLTIVLPAYNEERAIAGTLEQVRAAVPAIRKEAGLSDVQVVVVNDGSSDRTEQIAAHFAQATVHSFAQNRGYGAALKTGIGLARTTLVGFMDADGTCDPRAFGPLCAALQAERADLAIGVRLGPETEMPVLRRLGNRLFALLLGLLSRKRVRDSASGMRVLRRSEFERMLPLPDGLHFTPAMSARVLLKDDLKLIERPVPYAERTGDSKLSVVRDGFRFLSIILRTAILFRPMRILAPLAAVFGLSGIAFGTLPGLHYLRFSVLEEWMVYRVLLSFMLLVVASAVLSAAIVAQTIVETVNLAEQGTPAAIAKGRFSWTRGGISLLAVLLVLAGAFVVWPGLVEYASSGTVSLHWSRVVLAMLFVIWGVMLVTTQLLGGLTRFIGLRFRQVESACQPDRTRNPETIGQQQ